MPRMEVLLSVRRFFHRPIYSCQATDFWRCWAESESDLSSTPCVCIVSSPVTSGSSPAPSSFEFLRRIYATVEGLRWYWAADCGLFPSRT
jgi:hypothetical protein